METLRIFITGLPGCGKTTLIKRLGEELKEKGINFSGFITEEVRNKGARSGFTIRDLKTGCKLTFASVNEISQVKFHKYYLHMENFESIALNVFDNSNLILIDEIGKMEFYSYRFKQKLFEALKGNNTIIASLHRDFIKEFSIYGQIIALTRENFDEVYKSLIQTILSNLKYS